MGNFECGVRNSTQIKGDFKSVIKMRNLECGVRNQTKALNQPPLSYLTRACEW